MYGASEGDGDKGSDVDSEVALTDDLTVPGIVLWLIGQHASSQVQGSGDTNHNHGNLDSEFPRYSSLPQTHGESEEGQINRTGSILTMAHGARVDPSHLSVVVVSEPVTYFRHLLLREGTFSAHVPQNYMLQLGAIGGIF